MGRKLEIRDCRSDQVKNKLDVARIQSLISKFVPKPKKNLQLSSVVSKIIQKRRKSRNPEQLSTPTERGENSILELFLKRNTMTLYNENFKGDDDYEDDPLDTAAPLIKGQGVESDHELDDDESMKPCYLIGPSNKLKGFFDNIITIFIVRVVELIL